MPNRDMPRDEETLPGQGHGSLVPKELHEVLARFADICDYFSRQNMDVPAHVLETLRCISKLSIPERIPRMNQLNQELMEYLHAVGRNFGTQQ